jgi:inhibitor of cysteine peptidase
VVVREIEVRSSGEHVVASTGDRIVIQVPENATTGYRWVVSDLPNTLTVESDELVPPTSTRPGAGGERRIALNVRGAGEGQLVLSLERPWEGEAADRFVLSIAVS